MSPRYISPSAPLFLSNKPKSPPHQLSLILTSPTYTLTPNPSPNQPKTSTTQIMPDQNIPPNTPAARHAAEKRSWIIKIYCIIAFFDLGIFGLFPNWWAANSLAVVTALLYLGVRYLANIHAAAQEGDGGDDVELREGVVHNMVMEYMAGDGEACGDDAEGLGDAEENNDDDGGEDEHEDHGEEPEEIEMEDGAAHEIRSTQINIHIHRGGSMYINMMQGGTLLVNVFGEVDGMDSE